LLHWHAPCNDPGKSTGWGTQHVFSTRAHRNWCLILIGREHVTGNAWQKPWWKSWLLFDNPCCHCRAWSLASEWADETCVNFPKMPKWVTMLLSSQNAKCSTTCDGRRDLSIRCVKVLANIKVAHWPTAEQLMASIVLVQCGWKIFPHKWQFFGPIDCKWGLKHSKDNTLKQSFLLWHFTNKTDVILHK